MDVKELIDTWKTQRLTEEQTRELNEMLGNIPITQSVLDGIKGTEDNNETTA